MRDCRVIATAGKCLQSNQYNNVGRFSRLRVRCVLEGLVVLLMSPTLKQHQLPLLATTLHAPE